MNTPIILLISSILIATTAISKEPSYIILADASGQDAGACVRVEQAHTTIRNVCNESVHVRYHIFLKFLDGRIRADRTEDSVIRGRSEKQVSQEGGARILDAHFH